MRGLLARHGFTVISDGDLVALGAALGPGVAGGTAVMKHLRIAVADKRG